VTGVANGLPKTQRALIYRAVRHVEVIEHPVVEAGPDDVVLEVSHCGICGTDLHTVLEGMSPPDVIGGHEYSGRIVQLGSAVAGWALGDEVVSGGSGGCGACASCVAHRPSLCEKRGGIGDGPGGPNGAFAEFVRVCAAELLRVPAGVSLRDAALAEPLAVALHGITLAGVKPGNRVLVTGAGPIGMLTVAALAALGIEDVTVSEPSELRRRRALEVGARDACGPDSLETPGMPFTVVDPPFDAALECSGNPRAMESALAQLRRMGTLVLVGTGIRRPKMDHNRILLNELVVTGAFCYDENGIAQALDLLATGRLPTSLLIEPDDVPLEGMLEAAERCAVGELAGKVMIVPR
jgi:(R,R)-butanediol dehydrogenase/meso-butanediol dehydrogenase/diacetyl reductase